MKKIFITDHAKERFQQRTTISEKNYQWYTDEAFKHDLESAEFTGTLKSYLESLCHDQGQFVAKVFHNIIFIFNNNCGHRLVTVYPLPDEYKKLDDFKLHSNELFPCKIKLIHKETGQEYYWGKYNRFAFDDDIDDIATFKNQVSANGYIKNNNALDSYLDYYDIELCKLDESK